MLRVISETGNYEVPYDSSSLVIQNEDGMWNIRIDSFVMASYKSLDTVNKSLDSLRQTYIVGYPKYYQFTPETKEEPHEQEEHQ